MKIANLSQLKPLKPAIIENLSKDAVADADLASHLRDMGFIKGCPISITNKINKDMFIVKLGNNTPIAIDKSIIDKVNVSANDEFISELKNNTQKKSVLKRIKEFFTGVSA